MHFVRVRNEKTLSVLEKQTGRKTGLIGLKSNSHQVVSFDGGNGATQYQAPRQSRRTVVFGREGAA
jgi:hypothetical protein